MFKKENKDTEPTEPFSTEEKVSFLLEPSHYPFPLTAVYPKETHMSWVFLAGEYAYKLKKPVRNGLLNYQTPESRLTNCQKELSLNKHLAKDIYIAVVPLLITDTGKLQLEGTGRVADWLVKMKRIPDENLLDHAIREDRVDEQQLQEAAALLAGFYKTAAPVMMAWQDYQRKLEVEILCTRDHLLNASFGLPADVVKDLAAGQLAFLSAQPGLFRQRVSGKKIIDAHGDLRPEHICLGPQPAIIDRLEFSDELRIMDPADELAFLSMECEMLENAHAGRIFREVYREITHDSLPRRLLLFHMIRKACLRSYLVARHVLESRYADDPKWLARANAYLKKAETYQQLLAT